MGPEMMIATNIASAAFQATVEYAQKNRPTAEQAWRSSRLTYLEEQARGDNAVAQYTLGQFYQVHRDEQAHHWICQAANLGHSQAQLQLGHWYNEDRLKEDPWPYIDLRPDNREAYVWYLLAAKGGNPAAQPFMSYLESGLMTGPDVDEAHNMLAAWSPSGCGAIATAGRLDPE